MQRKKDSYDTNVGAASGEHGNTPLQHEAAISEHGNTLLHEAAVCGRADVVALLLDHRANVNDKDRYGRTALHLAAMYGRAEVVALLLRRGADFNARNIRGQTALHLAAWGGDANVVRLLLDRGADPNAKDICGGLTALHEAAMDSRGAYNGGAGADVVALLLDHRANVNDRDRYGRTALHLAAMYGRADVVALLAAQEEAHPDRLLSESEVESASAVEECIDR